MDEYLIPFLRNHADRERREGREMNAVRIEGAATELERLREVLTEIRLIHEAMDKQSSVTRAIGKALGLSHSATEGTK